MHDWIGAAATAAAGPFIVPSIGVVSVHDSKWKRVRADPNRRNVASFKQRSKAAQGQPENELREANAAQKLSGRKLSVSESCEKSQRDPVAT